MDNLTNSIFRNFELQFPLDAKDIESVSYRGYMEIAIKLSNGSTIIYDNTDNTVRSVGSLDTNIATKEMKREFGIRLRKIMKMKGITQKELADAIGIRQSQLSLYVNGKNDPSFYKVVQIAEVLNCNIEDLRYV